MTVFGGYATWTDAQFARADELDRRAAQGDTYAAKWAVIHRRMAEAAAERESK